MLIVIEHENNPLPWFNAHGADGHVYNDTKKRFFNGAQIHTSPVVNIDTYLADGYIQTVNSVYRIIV